MLQAAGKMEGHHRALQSAGGGSECTIWLLLWQVDTL